MLIFLWVVIPFKFSDAFHYFLLYVRRLRRFLYPTDAELRGLMNAQFEKKSRRRERHKDKDKDGEPKPTFMVPRSLDIDVSFKTVMPLE